ncbi:MAG: hypothetical protein OXT07_05070 [bacterium]|nr:hypothetical protein [bacterium]MDE0216271.1 hypothetical protein [bacterium]
MSKIEICKNHEPGPAWCAMGELGDAGYYAGADTRDELLALIQEAAEMEGVIPEISILGTEENPALT